MAQPFAIAPPGTALSDSATPEKELAGTNAAVSALTGSTRGDFQKRLRHLRNDLPFAPTTLVVELSNPRELS
jgi:hypothetical protein